MDKNSIGIKSKYQKKWGGFLTSVRNDMWIFVVWGESRGDSPSESPLLSPPWLPRFLSFWAERRISLFCSETSRSTN